MNTYTVGFLLIILPAGKIFIWNCFLFCLQWLSHSKGKKIFQNLIRFTAQPSQGNHPVDEFNDFKSTFDKLDEQERFNEAIDQGFERWEQT